MLFIELKTWNLKRIGGKCVLKEMEEDEHSESELHHSYYERRSHSLKLGQVFK